MSESRTLRYPLDHQEWYYANVESSAAPDGFGDEEAIHAVWKWDSAT
jgi:hypothetical protein